MKIGLPSIHAEDWTNVPTSDATHAVGFSADMAGAFARLVILHLQTPGGIATVLHNIGYESITYYASSKHVLTGVAVTDVRARYVRVTRASDVIITDSFVGSDLLPNTLQSVVPMVHLAVLRTLTNACWQRPDAAANTLFLLNAINKLLYTAKATDMCYVWDAQDSFPSAPHIQVIHPKRTPLMCFPLNSLLPQVVKAGDISTDELFELLL